MKTQFFIPIFAMAFILGISTFANANHQARIHNCTGYNLVIKEWHTAGACKVQRNINVPKNSITKLEWGLCPSTKSVWSTKLGDTIVPNIITVDEKTYYAVPDNTRDWYVFVEEPISRVEMPTTPGAYTDIRKFAKFYIFVTPAGIYGGGLYQGSWYNTITGQKATDAEIKSFNLQQ